jgi:hypothetical protein
VFSHPPKFLASSHPNVSFLWFVFSLGTWFPKWVPSEVLNLQSRESFSSHCVHVESWMSETNNICIGCIKRRSNKQVVCLFSINLLHYFSHCVSLARLFSPACLPQVCCLFHSSSLLFSCHFSSCFSLLGLLSFLLLLLVHKGCDVTLRFGNHQITGSWYLVTRPQGVWGHPEACES